MDPAGRRETHALSALVAGQALSAAWVAFEAPPEPWLAPDPSPWPGGPATAARTLWEILASRVPVASGAEREVLLALACVLAIAAATAWAAHQMYRGPGRWPAAVATAPLTTLALLRWLRLSEDAPFPALPFTLLAVLAVATLVRSLVRITRITPIARARAMACAGGAAALDPRAGMPLVALVVGLTLYDRTRVPREKRASDPLWLPLLFGAAVPAAAALALRPTWDGGGSLTATHFEWPPLEALAGFLPPVLTYPAIALVLLLVLPLRWRGGGLLAILLGAALVVHDDMGLLAPVPVLLAGLATAAAGWVWLAGSVKQRRDRLSLGMAVLAAMVLLTVAVGDPMRTPPPLATARRGPSMVRLLHRGLLAPGDAVFAHDPWIVASLRAQQWREGARPDLVVEDGSILGEADLGVRALELSGQGRRILSDSFNMAGRWRAAWAVDSGPVYWFVTDAEQSEREFTDLTEYLPDRSAPLQERVRWTRFHLERARFRRALDEPGEAALALPLDMSTKHGVAGRIELAALARPLAALTSELPLILPPDGTDGVVLAEAGDLLYGHQVPSIATSILLEATQAGHVSAWGTLARWQLRAGDILAARATVDRMLTRPELRDEAASVLLWLIARDRLADAVEIRDQMGATDVPTGREVAARLALLARLARPRPEQPPLKAPPPGGVPAVDPPDPGSQSFEGSP